MCALWEYLRALPVLVQEEWPELLRFGGSQFKALGVELSDFALGLPFSSGEIETIECAADEPLTL